MIVSKKWLSDYTPLTMSVDDMTDRLTMSGLNLEEFHSVGDDVAIDLEVTSNRPDCLGHIGVAREISILFDTNLTIPDAAVSESAAAAESVTSVELRCPDLCHEYHARVIQGVKIGPSPSWLSERLNAVGISSVNNVVDVTNYVMLECGQPLHAFDLDQLSEGRIIVRRAEKGERIKAIDQRDYELTDNMCVIADADRPVAVAGVMGGLETEISDKTTNVLIETASFEPLSVRATARTLKLHSPSSFRFERRVDRNQLDWASRRCCELIQQVAGGSILKGSVIAGDPPQKPGSIVLNFSQVERTLGIHVPAERCIEILKCLGFDCLKSDSDSAELVPPTWRQDLQRECDLIEEVARIHGYDNIPDNAALPVVATSKSPREQVGDAVRGLMVAYGFYEALTLSFVSEDQQQLFRPFGDRAAVAVQHSSRSHENQLRQSLIPSLLTCRRQNERHGTKNAELFEIAKVYLSAGENCAESESEPTMVGMVSGRAYLEVKGIVESLVARISPGSDLKAVSSNLPQFASGRGAALLLNGQQFGWLGELDRAVTDEIDLEDAVTIAEFKLNLLETFLEGTRRYHPIPRFPVVTRDLNLLLDESVTWDQTTEAIRQCNLSSLREISFSGQYRGKQIDAGKKSYLLTCTFMADNRTLTTEEVDDAVRKILDQCRSKLGATLR
ncbi:MAG: phenylalanine--tRNA ligase subunit beta [Planctomycetaceae bacterium]|nr:phenylalanine--tRNA ligase subunit beta [Planctomycetaceae bacterium]